MSALRRINKLLKPLNERLSSELGRVPTGEGKYYWAFSDHLTRAKRVCEIVNEELVPQYKILPPLPGEVTERVEPLYEIAPLCPDLKGQYLILGFVPTSAFESWRAAFGDNLEWPKGGEWVPVSAPTGIVALPPGVEPTMADTLYFIQVRKKDEETYLRKLFALDDVEKLVRQKRMAETALMIREDLPLWDKLPGKIDGPVSIIGCRGEEQSGKGKRSSAGIEDATISGRAAGDGQSHISLSN